MHSALKLAQLITITKNYSTKLRTVDRAIRSLQNGAAEHFNDLLVSRLSNIHDLPSYRIGVDNLYATRLKHGNNSAFATANVAR
jgi:hypothetical protein